MLSGPHAIGKSETARKLSANLNYVFVTSIAGFLAKKESYDINNACAYDIISYQNELFSTFEAIHEAMKENRCVFDRSPLDFAVYNIIQLEKLTQNYKGLMKSYAEECIKLTVQTCDLLIIPEADLEEEYEHKDGRPACDEGFVKYRERYVELLNQLVAATEECGVKVIRVPAEHQYEERLEYIYKEMFDK